ncbi:MAG: DUF4249 domain-containing protein [Bacteroidales bacterium]|jgi:hypothetical protein|nr:DUF4249 domain-containing protein [Bacteroidales bacterium]
MKRLMILCGMLPFMFAACEVEFDPNSEWKETTIVYCLLDQDDDTTFVRVEKAFLGEGNYIDFAKVKDSIYYKEDDLDVKIYGYNSWDNVNPAQVIPFQYTTDYAKPEGEFYSAEAPIYYALTAGQFNINRTYKLEVRNVKTGNVVSSTLQPLGNYTITKPENNKFSFKYDKGKYKMDIQWNNRNSSSPGAMPKLYQPVFRFYYKEHNEERFVDLPLGKVVNTYPTTHSLYYTASLDGILSAIKARLNNGQPKAWTDRINWMELFLTSCDVTMYDYININNADNNLLTDRPLYTNIDNGIGLFAARRTKINVVFTDYPVDARAAFMDGLVALGIGFEQ